MSAEEFGDERPWSGIACVAIEMHARPRNRHLLKLQRRAVFEETPEFFVIFLGSGKGCVVDRGGYFLDS
jgi:hypothetical protein